VGADVRAEVQAPAGLLGMRLDKSFCERRLKHSVCYFLSHSKSRPASLRRRVLGGLGGIKQKLFDRIVQRAREALRVRSQLGRGEKLEINLVQRARPPRCSPDTPPLRLSAELRRKMREMQSAMEGRARPRLRGWRGRRARCGEGILPSSLAGARRSRSSGQDARATMTSRGYRTPKGPTAQGPGLLPPRTGALGAAHGLLRREALRCVADGAGSSVGGHGQDAHATSPCGPHSPASVIDSFVCRRELFL